MLAMSHGVTLTSNKIKIAMSRRQPKKVKVIAGREYLTFTGAIEFLGISRETLRPLCERGVIKPSLKVGCERYFRKEFLIEQLDKIEKPGPNAAIEQGTGELKQFKPVGFKSRATGGVA